MKYRSSPLALLINFFQILFWIFFVAVLLSGTLLLLLSRLDIISHFPDPAAFLPLLCIIAVLAAIAAAYLAFFRHNITIEADRTAIRFLRGRKEYLHLLYDGFVFTSYVVKQRINLIPTSTTRYLRAMQMETGRIHDYRCYNLDRKTFESFIAYIRSLQPEYLPEPANEESPTAGQVDFDPDRSGNEAVYTRETLVFTIDKNLFISRYQKPLWLMITIFSVFILSLLVLQLILTPERFMEHLVVNISFFALLVVIFFPIPIIMFGIPLAKIKKNTPEKITLFHDHIVFDNKSFYFSRIKQIRMTPPAYQSNGLLKRKITVIEENKTTVFFVGDDKDVNPMWAKKGKKKVFADYINLCNELEAALLNRPGKFMFELG